MTIEGLADAISLFDTPVLTDEEYEAFKARWVAFDAKYGKDPSDIIMDAGRAYAALMKV